VNVHFLKQAPSPSDATPQRYKGWMSTDTTYADKMNDETGKKHVQLHTKHGNMIHLLDSIIQLLKRHHFSVYFLTLPSYKYYYQNLDSVRWDRT